MDLPPKLLKIGTTPKQAKLSVLVVEVAVLKQVLVGLEIKFYTMGTAISFMTLGKLIAPSFKMTLHPGHIAITSATTNFITAVTASMK